MRGNKSKITEILEKDKKFIIPVYQRNYEWKKEHCERLFSDLEKLNNNNLKSHFFGSIVVSYNDISALHGAKEFIIIDGQ